MAQVKPTIWRCEHHCPIEVVRVGSGQRHPGCLGGGACGPVRDGSEEAMLALRNHSRHGVASTTRLRHA